MKAAAFSCLVVLGAAFGPLPAVAQSAFHPGRVLPMPRVIVRPGLPAVGEHAYFGWITQLAPHAMKLRLRSGRVILVNTDIAVRTDRYSAPLFVQKIVVVRGQLDGGGVLHAETIEKLPEMTPDVRPDR